MPQLHLPMFPDGVTHITNELAFEKKDGRITYFNAHMPVFTHDENDIATFRMITSQFGAKQSDIIRAFGVTKISVKRSVKLYREKGTRGFFAPRVTRGAAVLVDAVVEQVEELFAGGASVPEVANTLGLKRNTLEKAIRAGRLHAPVKKNSPTVRP
jgi:transposase-like protein